jgi:hypothetical protein
LRRSPQRAPRAPRRLTETLFWAQVTLAVGDPIASVAGRASASLPPSRLKSVLRTKTVGSKSVAGSLAFLIAAAAANAAALAAAAALAPAPAAAEFALALPRAAAAALAAALAGAVAELCANDSLVLPWCPCPARPPVPPTALPLPRPRPLLYAQLETRHPSPLRTS